jgi:hypothetical protein
VSNRTQQLHSFRLSGAESEAFLFCGYKLHQFALPPGASHTATFNMVPIAPGDVQLPPLRLFCITTNQEVFDARAHQPIFVRPCGVDRRVAG